MNVITDNKWIGQRTIRPDGADKVTGRAAFAADTTMPGMIWGKVLRSPHPHARIISIDTSKAEALPGVKAVVTREDFADQPSEFVPAGEAVKAAERGGRSAGRSQDATRPRPSRGAAPPTPRCPA